MLAYRFVLSALGVCALSLAGCALAGPGMGRNDLGDEEGDLAGEAPADLRRVDLREEAGDLFQPTFDLPQPTGVPILYGADRASSPITADIVQNLKAIAALAPSAHEDVFAKVGDSHTVSAGYMHCFDDGTVNLAAFTDLTDTIEHFKTGDAGGNDPYDRESLAAVGGKTAGWAITGSPSPIDQELAAITPRYATVMFGTNEIGSDSPTEAQQGSRAASYAGNMMTLLEKILAAGAIPILSSIPPRTSLASDRLVPLFVQVARTIAQWKQIPFVDVESQLRPLTDPIYGLAGDGVHLQTGGGGSCVFTADGLRYGNNVRNLATMQMLDVLKSVLFDNDPAPDTGGTVLTGTGDRDDPFVIPETALPFGDVRTTAGAGFSVIDKYVGCSAQQDESGTEFWYRVDLTAPAKLRALVADRGTVDIDVHLLDGTGEAAGCLERDDTQIVSNELAAGSYYFVLDTFVKSGAPQSGQYLFVVLKEP